jgi:hypothetical protein
MYEQLSTAFAAPIVKWQHTAIPSPVSSQWHPGDTPCHASLPISADIFTVPAHKVEIAHPGKISRAAAFF